METSTFSATPFTKPCSCVSVKGLDAHPHLQNLLPTDPEYEYAVCEFFFHEDSSDKFSCRFRLNIADKEAAMQWLLKFSDKTKTMYVTDKTFPGDRQRLVYKVAVRCHRNSRPEKNGVKNPRPKHTNCPATAIITVKKFSLRTAYKSRDFHLPSHPMLVVLHHVHNHEMLTADTLKYLTPGKHVRKIFVDLFHKGHSPSSALKTYKRDFNLVNDTENCMRVVDGSICPRLRWVFNLYYKVTTERENARGIRNLKVDKSLMTSLESFVRDFNERCGEPSAAIRGHRKDDFVVSVVTPLMRRALKKLPACSEAVFVDSSWSVETMGCNVHVLMSDSPAGGVPVGVALTSSYSKGSTEIALQLLKTLVDEECFCGNGLRGPKLFVIDDVPTIRTGFSSQFPTSTLVLSSCHVLRMTWRYLCNSSDSIPSDEGKELFALTKSMLYAPDPVQLDARFAASSQSPLMAKFPSFFSYFEQLYQRRNEWAICYIESMDQEDYNLNNLCDVSMRVIKDKASMRIKPRSGLQVLEFLTTEFEEYYRCKLVDAANEGIGDDYLGRLEAIPADKLDDLSCERIDSDWYKVYNVVTEKEYDVEAGVGLCSCALGSSGSSCEHQYYVYKTCKVNIGGPYETESEDLKYIATGCTNDAEDDWYTIHVPVSVEEDVAMELVVETQEKPYTCADVLSPPPPPSPVPAVTKIQVVDPREVLENLQSVFDSVKQRALGDANVLLAVSDFVENYKTLNSSKEIITAFGNFGKGKSIADNATTQVVRGTLRQIDAFIANKRVCSMEHDYAEKSAERCSDVV